MHLNKHFVLFLASCATLVASPASARQSCGNPLLEMGYDGRVLSGSKDSLIAAAQRGEPVRIGWELDFNGDGEADVSHWAEAAFVSINQGEAYAQVTAVQRQLPRPSGRVDLADSYAEWRGMLGTDGRLQGIFSDGSAFPADIKVRTIWCSTLTAAPRWTAVYRSGINGETLEGSKDALFSAIRAGQPIQIGWGFSGEREGKRLAIEHLIAPVFVTIVNGDHVTAQLPEHIAQRSYIDIDQSFFGDPAVMWRGLMTSKGTFDAVWVNRATGEVVRRFPQRAMLTWYTLGAAAPSAPTLAVPGGVTRDEARASEVLPR